MARVDEDDVRLVIETSGDISMAPFIRAASLLTDKVRACATSRGYTLSDAQLLEIERYLAAHFYSLRDPQYKSKSTERASASFMDRDWLATAKMFDDSGCLEALTTGKRARMAWLGKPKSSQIDYDDRD